MDESEEVKEVQETISCLPSENTSTSFDDLNAIVVTFDNFHKMITDLEEERNTLLETIKKYEAENTLHIQNVSLHKKEMESLQNVIAELHKRMSHNLDLTEKNKHMQMDNEKNNQQICNLNKELGSRRLKYEADLLLVKQESDKRLHKAVNDALDIERRKEEELEMVIATHEATISTMEKKVEDVAKRKEGDLLKVTMEYENKIAKLQMQKTHTPTPQVSSTTQEIFRQKQQHMKLEYEHKLSSLKQSNDDLNRRIMQLERAEHSKLSLSTSKKRRY